MLTKLYVCVLYSRREPDSIPDNDVFAVFEDEVNFTENSILRKEVKRGFSLSAPTGKNLNDIVFV